MRVFIALAALAAVACAADMGKGMTAADGFKLFDTNKDDKVTYDEFEAALSKYLDTDQDGYINATEQITATMKNGMSKEFGLFMLFVADNDNDTRLDKAERQMSFNKTDNNMDGHISMDEWEHVAMMEHKMAKHVDEKVAKLKVMVAKADANSDGQLSGDEMWSVVSGGDMNGDNRLDKKEFVHFWMKSTGAGMFDSMALFKKFDGDKDGKFGGDEEKKAIYAGFDYDKSGVVSDEEFINSMVYMGAQIHKEMMMMMYNEFKKADSNGDHKIDEAEFKAAHSSMDTDKDNAVSAVEFLKYAADKEIPQKGALFVFFRKDMNDDNKVDASEMEKAFHHADKDMDGTICMKEYGAMKMMVHEMIEKATIAAAKVLKMAEAADADGNAKLNGTEMWNVIAPADTNGDAKISRDEFAEYWSSKTGAVKDHSGRLFDIFDGNKDGFFEDNSNESKGVYTGFDYDKDGFVSTDEFVNAMVFLAAQIADDLMKEKMIMGHNMNFNVTAVFMSVDTDNNGLISKVEFNAVQTAMDENKDGFVNASEFIKSYTKTGMTPKGSLYIFFRMDDNEDQKLDNAERDSTFDSFDINDDQSVSFDEYAALMNKTMGELMIAKTVGAKLEMMFDMHDMGMDGVMNATEMTGLFAAADNDKDGLVSEKEFRDFWMAKTGEPQSRTDVLFGILDSDSDGFFGNDNEKTNLFDGFDYSDDQMVTEDEFMNSMLWLYAKVVRQMEAIQAVKDVVGFFF